MDFPKHQFLFSPYRMARYLKAAGDSEARATQLYQLNIQASQALYPLISILEIALRNAIDRELSKHFGVTDWLISCRKRFANHADMVKKNQRGRIFPDHFFSDKLQRAEDKLHFKKATVTQGKVLAELTLGFWVKFYDSVTIKILKGAPLQAFPNRPGIKLGLIHSRLMSILELRNRISHNEPICFDSAGNLCLPEIKSYETNISDALSWIDAELKAWADKMNFFQPVYNRIASI